MEIHWSASRCPEDPVRLKCLKDIVFRGCGVAFSRRSIQFAVWSKESLHSKWCGSSCSTWPTSRGQNVITPIPKEGLSHLRPGTKQSGSCEQTGVPGGSALSGPPCLLTQNPLLTFTTVHVNHRLCLSVLSAEAEVATLFAFRSLV